LRNHEQYPFIRVDVANAWPRVSLAKTRKDDGSRYFGPFRNAATARKTVELINRVVPLRTCPRSFRDARSYGSPRLELDLGRCLGPCVGRADRDEYMALVHSVIEYVDGRDSALHEVLWRGLERAADALDFERAARLRRDLQSSLSLTASQRRLREATEVNRLVLVTPGVEVDSKEAMVIAQGRLWGQLHLPGATTAGELTARFVRCWQRFMAFGLRQPDHDSVDDMHILSSWLSRHAGHPAMIPIPDPIDAVEWEKIAQAVLQLRQDDLEFDAWRTIQDLDASDLTVPDGAFVQEGDE
jgi:excinuclease UvrABC nuclease subunit